MFIFELLTCCFDDPQVRDVAERLQPGVVAQACGSYRRGQPTCGDVDILVTHPDGKSHVGMYGKLLAALKETGVSAFDHLVNGLENCCSFLYLQREREI